MYLQIIQNRLLWNQGGAGNKDHTRKEVRKEMEPNLFSSVIRSPATHYFSNRKWDSSISNV